MKKPRKRKGNQGKGWKKKHVPLRTGRQKHILLAMQIPPKKIGEENLG